LLCARFGGLALTGKLATRSPLRHAIVQLPFTKLQKASYCLADNLIDTEFHKKSFVQRDHNLAPAAEIVAVWLIFGIVYSYSRLFWSCFAH
jgi:hypothetical protein